MPKQTARKCTGGAAPYNLMAARVKKFAAGSAAGAGDAAAAEDDASRDLSVSSAGLDEEEFKVYSMTELQSKSKEKLVQLVLRLQNSLQDLLEAEDDDEDEEYGMGQQDELDEEDEDGEDFNGSNVTGGDGQAVVPLEDDDEDEDEDDDDEEEDGDADNGDVNGDVAAGSAADSDVSNDVTGSKDQN